MDIKTEKKIIAKHIEQIVDGKAEFSRYNDNNNLSYIHIMTINDAPESGVNTYSTIGLCEYNIGLQIEKKPLRVELIIAIDNNQERVADILATCAFCIINSHYKCMPGVIFNDVISYYIEDSDMKHVLFVQPFLWEDSYCGLTLNDKTIEWLLAVPISEGEYKYAEKYGSDALEELFEKYNIDIFNLYRESVI